MFVARKCMPLIPIAEVIAFMRACDDTCLPPRVSQNENKVLIAKNLKVSS